MPEKYTRGGGGTRIYWDLIQWTFIWPNIGVPANNWFDWTTWPAPAGNYFELYIWFESFASVLLLWGNSAIFNLHNLLVSYHMNFPVLFGINFWKLINFRKFNVQCVLYLYYTPIRIMGLLPAQSTLLYWKSSTVYSP